MRRLRMAAMAAVIGGGMLLSSKAMARDQCSGVYRKGRASHFLTKTRRATIIQTPLLDGRRYMRLRVPKEYMADLEKKSRRMPKSKKVTYTSRMIQLNIANAFKYIQPGKMTWFPCVPLTTTKLSPKPATRTPPRRPPARKPPASRKRNRTFMIDLDTPSTRPRPRTAAPLLPKLTGGSGLKSRPYVINVPVPHTQGGKTLYRELFVVNVKLKNIGPVAFMYKFISKSATSRKTSTHKLASAMYSPALKQIRDKLKAKGYYGSMSNFLPKIKAIVRRAIGRNPFIKKYVK